MAGEQTVAADDIVVFTGPTLDPRAVVEVLPCRVQPPAQLGSIFRAVRDAPKVLAIIDGYYESVPSVWHREVLWALHHGVWVYGASSMGALRAAELDAYGMRGVGAIYEAYRTGVLTDDDDVAVAHGPAASRHQTVSEAMVNVYATLDAAVRAGVLERKVADEVGMVAKRRFYAERDWPMVLHDARAAGVGEGALDAIGAFVRDGGAVDQKRLDAIELLQTIATDLVAGWSPGKPAFEWEHTSAWDLLVRTEQDEPARLDR
jgi:hypothetical protein